MIEALADATTVADRLSIVKEILQSTITRCTDKTKLSTVKVKITKVKEKNGEVLVAIKLKIKNKRKKKKDNDIKITIIKQWIKIQENPPSTQPPTSGIYFLHIKCLNICWIQEQLQLIPHHLGPLVLHHLSPLVPQHLAPLVPHPLSPMVPHPLSPLVQHPLSPGQPMRSLWR